MAFLYKPILQQPFRRLYHLCNHRINRNDRHCNTDRDCSLSDRFRRRRRRQASPLCPRKVIPLRALSLRSEMQTIMLLPNSPPTRTVLLLRRIWNTEIIRLRNAPPKRAISLMKPSTKFKSESIKKCMSLRCRTTKSRTSQKHPIQTQVGKRKQRLSFLCFSSCFTYLFYSTLDHYQIYLLLQEVRINTKRTVQSSHNEIVLDFFRKMK